MKLEKKGHIAVNQVKPFTGVLSQERKAKKVGGKIEQNAAAKRVWCS